MVAVGATLALVIGGYAAHVAVKNSRAPAPTAPPTQTTTHLVQDVQLLHVPQTRVQIVSDLPPVDLPVRDPYYRYSYRNSRHMDSYSLEMDSPPRFHGKHYGRNQSYNRDFTDDEWPTKPKSRRSRHKYQSDSEEEESSRSSRNIQDNYEVEDNPRKSKTSRRKLEADLDEEREPKVAKGHVTRNQCKPSSKKGHKGDDNDDDTDEGGFSAYISNQKQIAKK